MLAPLTTTRIPGRILLTGTEAIRLFGLLMTRPCKVKTVTSSPLRDFAHMDAYAAKLRLYFSDLREHKIVKTVHTTEF